MNLNPRYLNILALLILSYTQLQAQGDAVLKVSSLKPEFRRQLNHDNIDKLQQAILHSDGKADRLFVSTANEDINFLVTQSVVNKVDRVQFKIEKDSILDHRLKVYYLHGLENILKYFKSCTNPAQSVLLLFPLFSMLMKCVLKKTSRELALKILLSV